MWKRICVVCTHVELSKGMESQGMKAVCLRNIVLGKDGEGLMGSVGVGLSERRFSSRAPLGWFRGMHDAQFHHCKANLRHGKHA